MLFFKLPLNKIPEAVFINGRMLTLGLVGTDVECAYLADTLLFPLASIEGVIVNNKRTLILQYPGVIYHYNIHHNGSIIEFEENSNTLKTTLLSKITREAPCSSRET